MLPVNQWISYTKDHVSTKLSMEFTCKNSNWLVNWSKTNLSYYNDHVYDGLHRVGKKLTDN